MTSSVQASNYSNFVVTCMKTKTEKQSSDAQLIGHRIINLQLTQKPGIHIQQLIGN